MTRELQPEHELQPEMVHTQAERDGAWVRGYWQDIQRQALSQKAQQRQQHAHRPRRPDLGDRRRWIST